MYPRRLGYRLLRPRAPRQRSFRICGFEGAGLNVGSTEGQRPCHPEVADGDDAGVHGVREDQLREHRNHRNDIIPSRSPSASSLWGCFWLVCGGCRQEGFGVGFASALRSVHASHFGYTPKKKGGEEGLLHAFLVFLWALTRAAAEDQQGR